MDITGGGGGGLYLECGIGSGGGGVWLVMRGQIRVSSSLFVRRPTGGGLFV